MDSDGTSSTSQNITKTQKGKVHESKYSIMPEMIYIMRYSRRTRSKHHYIDRGSSEIRLAKTKSISLVFPGFPVCLRELIFIVGTRIIEWVPRKTSK